MASDTTTVWGHGRTITGSAHTLAVGGSPRSDAEIIDLPSAATKTPVLDSVLLTAVGLTGDQPAADSNRAVFVYPWEHYPFWADLLDTDLGDVAFGENLTSIGLLETEVYIGDTFTWGTATVQVSRPGALNVRVAGQGLPQVETCPRSGFYLRVLNTGRVGPQDNLRLIDVDPFGLSVAAVNTALVAGPAAAGLTLERVALAAHLMPAGFLEQLGVTDRPVDPEFEPMTGTAG